MPCPASPPTTLKVGVACEDPYTFDGGLKFYVTDVAGNPQLSLIRWAMGNERLAARYRCSVAVERGTHVLDCDQPAEDAATQGHQPVPPARVHARFVSSSGIGFVVADRTEFGERLFYCRPYFHDLDPYLRALE